MIIDFKLFEQQDSEYVYVIDSLLSNYYTTDMNLISVMIRLYFEKNEDNVKDIKPLRHYADDINNQNYSYKKLYHSSVGDNGWLNKNINIIRFKTDKYLTKTDKVYILTDEDSIYENYITNDKNNIEDLVKLFISDNTDTQTPYLKKIYDCDEFLSYEYENYNDNKNVFVNIMNNIMIDIQKEKVKKFNL